MDKPQLRFAVAMKGGVSLAVWIGGACRELSLLTRSDPAYEELTSHLGGVAVDVISGSSAGGLNGVLLAQAQAYGAAFDHRIRNTWLELADLGRLARKPVGEVPLSLLRGDHAFYPLLAEKITQLRPGPDEEEHRRVRLLVTATRVHERPRTLHPTVGRPVHAASSAAWFTFTSPIGGPDGQGHHITPETESTMCLAYAARCTSSFPGAFEPGRIDVTTGTTPYPAMAGCSSETGAGDDGRESVKLMDGGVLDNIPIAWALRGIAAQPATGPVDRWLLYLDPSPNDAPLRDDGPATGTADSASPIGFLTLISRAKKVMSSVESLLDDSAELASAARDARAADAALRRAAAVGRDDIESAKTLLERYALDNSQAEAVRLRQLLLDPERVTAGDPLPVPAPAFRHAGEEKLSLFLRPLSKDRLLALGRPDRGWERLGEVGACASTPFVAARALTVLLRSIQDVEDSLGEDGAEASQGFRQVRLRLYAVRDVVEHVIALRDRHFLRAVDEVTTLDEAYLLATRRVGRALRDAVNGCGPANLLDLGWWQSLLRRLPSHAVADVAEPLPAEAPYAVLWEGVLACQASVAAVGFMRDLVAATAHWTSDVLAASEVLTGMLRPDPLSSPADPSFAVISAAAETPLAGLFWPDSTALRPDDLPGHKLCGNELFNFGGFLSARWRHHDWIWGRLDAIPTIMAALHHRRPGANDPFSLDEAQRLFRAGFPEPMGEQLWQAVGLSRLWDADDTTPRDRRIAVWTARRQLEVLAEERAFRVDGDDPPPVPDHGVEAPDAPPIATFDDMAQEIEAMSRVGVENPIYLLRAPSLRRTFLRLGIGAFRGLTGVKPVDQGPPERPAAPSLQTTGAWAFVLRVVLGPFVVPALLLGLTAPVQTFAAGLLAYAGLALAVGHGATATHLLVGVALVLSIVGMTLRRHTRSTARITKEVLRTVWISGASFLVLWTLAWVYVPVERIPLAAGALAALAFLISQGGPALDAAPTAGWKAFALLLGGGAATGGLVWLLALGSLPGILILYSGLGAAFLSLYYWAGSGASRPIAYPVPRGQD